MVVNSNEMPVEKCRSRGLGRGHWLFLVAWWGLVVLGFCYVAGLLCQRENPFRSGNPGFRDLTLVVLIAPLLFFAGPRHNWIPSTFSVWEIFKWNGLCYTLPFFLVLHWAYLGPAIGADFSLKASDLRSMDSRSLTALAVAVFSITALLICHLVWAHRSEILSRYLIVLCSIPLIAWAITVVLADSHFVHVHHYCLGAFLFPFFRFRNFLSLVAQATFLGLAIEGISRWGMDPMWYSRVAG